MTGLKSQLLPIINPLQYAKGGNGRKKEGYISVADLKICEGKDCQGPPGKIMYL